MFERGVQSSQARLVHATEGEGLYFRLLASLIHIKGNMLTGKAVCIQGVHQPHVWVKTHICDALISLTDHLTTRILFPAARSAQKVNLKLSE